MQFTLTIKNNFPLLVYVLTVTLAFSYTVSDLLISLYAALQTAKGQRFQRKIRWFGETSRR